MELAQTVAQNWRAVDAVTLTYCESVARILKERHAEMTQAKGGLKQTKKRTPKKTSSAVAAVTPIPVHSAAITEDEEKVPCRRTSSNSAPMEMPAARYNEMIDTSFTSAPAIFNDDNVANPPPESASECVVQTRYCYWSDRLPSTPTIVSRTSMNENDEASNQSEQYQDENIMPSENLPDMLLSVHPEGLNGSLDAMPSTDDMWIEGCDDFDELLTFNIENPFF